MQKGAVLSQKLEERIRQLRPQPQVTSVSEKQQQRLREKVERMQEEHRSESLMSRQQSEQLKDGFKWCMQGDEYGVRVYLQEGAAVNERDPVHGRALLHHAAAHGHLHIVRYLLNEANADVNHRTVMGRATAVHIAAMQQRRQVLFHLLLSGADPDLVDDLGNTGLHYARKRGVVAALMKFQANPLIRNKEGKLPLDVLTEAGCDENVVQYLAQVTDDAWRERLAVVRSVSRAGRRSPDELQQQIVPVVKDAKQW